MLGLDYGSFRSAVGGEEGKLRLFDCFASGGQPKAPLRLANLRSLASHHFSVPLVRVTTIIDRIHRSWKTATVAMHATAFSANGERSTS